MQASVLRTWLVKAVEAHREEVVKQFFSRHGDSLMQGPNGADWGVWFALPFLQSPAGDPRFQVWLVFHVTGASKHICTEYLVSDDCNGNPLV